MNNVYEIALLLDFYGQLLTPRQFEILDLQYNQDYSLGEIAEQLNISRQGVFDNAKRAKAVLGELEEKLGLVRKFSEQQVKAQELLQYIKSIETAALQADYREQLKTIEEKVEDIVNAISL